MKKLLVLFVVALTAGTAVSKECARHQSPEQVAVVISARMTKICGLTPDQKVKVHDIILQRERQRVADRAKFQKSQDKEALKQAAIVRNKRANASLRKVLTPDQWQEWLDYNKVLRERRAAAKHNKQTDGTGGK